MPPLFCWACCCARSAIRRARPVPSSRGILVVNTDAERQGHPGMPPAMIDGDLRGRKIRIGKATDRHGYRARFMSFFGVEEIGAADGTEPESEARALIPSADIFGCDAAHLVMRPKACECGEDATGPALASETVAYTDAPRLAFKRDGQLTARTGRSSRHDGPPRCSGLLDHGP